MSVSPTVNAFVPLALLEAIRNLDTPLDDGLPAELAVETYTKRLGLSSTVAAQIDRYRGMAGRRTTVTDDEAVQVFRLVGRRPDATLVYADAGRRAARLAAQQFGARPGLLSRLLPRRFRRRLGVRRASRVLHRAFGVDLQRDLTGTWTKLGETLATRSGFEGNGCYFYAAMVAEMLRVASGFEGSMLHDRCRARGDETCLWKAAEADYTW